MGLIDYFQNFFKNSSNPFIAKESLGNLKKKLKERFDIPSHNIWVINDYSKNHRTGYVEIPKKDDVCQASIEEIVSKTTLCSSSNPSGLSFAFKSFGLVIEICKSGLIEA